MENSKKAVQTLAYGSCSHNISRPRKLDRNTENVFFFHFLNVQLHKKRHYEMFCPVVITIKSVRPIYWSMLYEYIGQINVY